MTLIAAYNVLIVSALGAGIAHGTGEGAEETMEHIKGISKSLIEEHSDSALISLIALIIVGLISLIGLFFYAPEFSFHKTLRVNHPIPILAKNEVQIDIEKVKLALDRIYKRSNLSVQQALKSCCAQKSFPASK